MGLLGDGHPMSQAQWRRWAARRRRERVAFVFSGGGPLGALQVGALRAVTEAGIIPDLVVGTSVGALNATFMAFEPSAEGARELEQIWRGLRDDDLFPGRRFKTTWARFLIRGNRVFENSGIRRLVENRLGDATFEEARIRLGIVATDLDSGGERVFTSGSLIDPLLASAAMPGIFPPVEIDGRRFIDGGVTNNVPISPALDLGARTVYVFGVSSNDSRKRPLVRPLDYLLHAFSLSRAQRFALEQMAFADQRVRVVILPAPSLDFHVPFASMAHTADLIDMSYRLTRSFLAEQSEREPSPLAGRLRVEAMAPAE